MADPKYQISNHKGLTKSDFESLQGTALYVRMFRNRCFVKIDGLNTTKEHARKEIGEWLRDNCNTLYHFPTGEISWVYIEGAADAVNFKMRFHDQAVTIPPPPPPATPAPQKAKPVAARPKPVAPSPTEVADWMKILQDGRSKEWTSDLDGYDDLISDHGISPDVARKVLDHINKRGL